MLSNKKIVFVILAVLVLCPVVHSNASSVPDVEIISRNAPIFPHMLFTDTINNWIRAKASKPYWAYTAEELENINQMMRFQTSMLLNYDVLAYYGHPGSRNMGILGRHSIQELDRMLTELAAEYEAIGGRRIQKAFYLIYGTVWPRGDIGIIRESLLMPYIEYGLENNILVFIDHQIGRFDPIDSLRRMLPYLRFPNVHLALDPEWRTDQPGIFLGHVTGEEINRAQQVMEEYLIEHNLPGERMLVIHQFSPIMIRNRQDARSDFNRVRLIHCADGIGSPALKRHSYAFIAQATNMPLKGFKLFYNLGIPGAGFDNPLMTPSEVYRLNPRPVVIMYQ
jgi:hypothetical protein